MLGWSLFAIAKLPFFGLFSHWFFHVRAVTSFARRRALDLDVDIGPPLARVVASLASLSAFSFPLMPVLLGHHEIVRRLWGSRSRKSHNFRWNRYV